MPKSKNRYFYHILVFPGDAPGAITLNVGWKENSMLTNYLVACTHLSSTVSQLFEPQVQKIAIFSYRRPHFCFPGTRRCDYHAVCCMNEKTIQCLPNPSQHLSSIVSELYDAQVNAQVQKSLFLPHFGFPWGRPWGNHAKCCIDGKRIRCLEIVSLNLPI